MKSEDAIKEIIREYGRATKIFGHFHSPHEGYAVILEEVDELWDAIKDKTCDYNDLKKEAVQIGAMALRFLCDCIVEK